MSEPLLLSRVIASMVNISRKASKIIRQVKISGELGVQEKAKEDYVTVADFQAQMCIVKSLENLFPKMKLCGEEGELKGEYADIETKLNDEVLSIVKNLADKVPKYKTIKEEDLFVWIDPLDGTREFVQSSNHNEEVTILIGVSWKGEAIAGVMNQPFWSEDMQDYNGDRVLWGITEFGAFQNSNEKRTFEPIKPVNLSSANNKIQIITTRSHLTPAITDFLNTLDFAEITNKGGCGFKTLKVIEGTSDCYLYPRSGTKRWDSCAPEAILRALGGVFTDVFNKNYNYADKSAFENSRGIVATLKPQHHKLVIEKLTKAIKDEVLENEKKENMKV